MVSMRLSVEVTYDRQLTHTSTALLPEPTGHVRILSYLRSTVKPEVSIKLLRMMQVSQELRDGMSTLEQYVDGHRFHAEMDLLDKPMFRVHEVNVIVNKQCAEVHIAVPEPKTPTARRMTIRRKV